MIELILMLWWGVLIFLSLRSRDAFVLVFVFTQFLFVGLGLIAFSILPMPYLDRIFPDFNFFRIDATDFRWASLITLLGVTFSVAAFLAFSSLIRRSPIAADIKLSAIHPMRLLLIGLFSIVVCAYFVEKNWSSFFLLALAEDGVGLADALDLRMTATSDYLLTLAVYNVCPAVAIAGATWHGQGTHSFYKSTFVLLLILFSSVALLLTFQKRPLIVFLFGLLLAYKIRRDLGYGHVSPYFALLRFFRGSVFYLILLLLALFGLYYFYTGYRFGDYGAWEGIASVSEIVLTRVVGRLSIPAAFYVDYFPDFHPHYGLDNVGLLARIFDRPLFPDTVNVFSAYSRSYLDGSVAASVFTDAYGQAGILWVPVVGFFVGVILILMRLLLVSSKSGASKILLFTFGFLYIYYLSQSSFFRASLGYGGLIWFLIWAFLVGKQGENENKKNLLPFINAPTKRQTGV